MQDSLAHRFRNSDLAQFGLDRRDPRFSVCTLSADLIATCVELRDLRLDLSERSGELPFRLFERGEFAIELIATLHVGSHLIQEFLHPIGLDILDRDDRVIRKRQRARLPFFMQIIKARGRTILTLRREMECPRVRMRNTRDPLHALHEIAHLGYRKIPPLHLILLTLAPYPSHPSHRKAGHGSSRNFRFSLVRQEHRAHEQQTQ